MKAQVEAMVEDARWMAVRRFSETLSKEQVALLSALVETTSQPGDFLREVLDHNVQTAAAQRRPSGIRLLEAVLSYALGRQTSAVMTAAEKLTAAWPDLFYDDKERLLDMIEAAFDKGDVGADMDSRVWDSVLVMGGRSSRHVDQGPSRGF